MQFLLFKIDLFKLLFPCKSMVIINFLREFVWNKKMSRQSIMEYLLI